VCAIVTTTLPPDSVGEMLTEVITTAESQPEDADALLLVVLVVLLTAPAGAVRARNSPATAATTPKTRTERTPLLIRSRMD
jgi:hypothetical protein